jgi:hypothetical protein
LDDFLPLRRSPSSSLLLELEVEYAELESTSLVLCGSTKEPSGFLVTTGNPANSV